MIRRSGLLLVAFLSTCSSFLLAWRPGPLSANGARHGRRTCASTTIAIADVYSTRSCQSGRGTAAAPSAATTPFRTQRHGQAAYIALRATDEELEEERHGKDEEDLSTDASGGEQQHEAGDDASVEKPSGRGAENMELRDFRARLLSKGLDGWGADGDVGQAEEDEASAGGTAVPRSERWAHPLVRPELGCLVLANDKMFTQRQQYFYRAVILVIQHGDDGTVGLILNRPTTFTMGDVCTGDLYRVPGMEDNVLYMGGDVQGARDDGLDVVNLMHGREDVPGMEVMKGLRLGGLKEALELIAEGRATPEEFKFFSRYAGWGPGQLEGEVLAGDWALAACDLESILQNHNHPDQPGHFWGAIMSRLTRRRSQEEEEEEEEAGSG